MNLNLHCYNCKASKACNLHWLYSVHEWHENSRVLHPSCLGISGSHKQMLLVQSRN